MSDETLSEPRKKEIFLALVEAQDQGQSVQKSREIVAKRFRVAAREVLLIEGEGMEKEWPPLSDT